jgi:hypothetical protein
MWLGDIYLTKKQISEDQMSDNQTLQLLRVSQLDDPLTEVTRRERRNLLGVSLVSLAITMGGLIPTQISALGLIVSTSEQAGLLILLALTLVYFLLAFLIFGFTDLNNWRIRFRLCTEISRTPIGPIRYVHSSNSPNQFDAWEYLNRRIANIEEDKLARSFVSSSTVRMAFEFLVPCGIGIVALAATLDSYVSVAHKRGWYTILAFPWSLIIIALIGSTFCVLWRLFTTIEPPKNRQVSYEQYRMEELVKKVQQLSKLHEDDPLWRELVDEIDNELEQLGMAQGRPSHIPKPTNT